MITITRRLAALLRPVLRRAQNTPSSPGPAIGFIAAKEGLIVKADCGDVIVEYRVPGRLADEALWLPFDLLTDCEGKKDDPVEMEASGEHQVTARWQDRSGPQLISYDTRPPAGADKFQARPTDLAANPPHLLQALADASEIADPDNTRYALGNLQLSGSRGEIAATDGCQLLVQKGFTFPWPDDLLVPRAKFLASPELSGIEPVAVGKSGNHVAIDVGPWTFYLRVDTAGRFPKVAQNIPAPTAAKTRCRLSADDRRFLAETLLKLPCDDEGNRRVTLDLNGHVAVRAKPADQSTPTEVVLTNSHFTGDTIRISMNRTYLTRAMRLGLDEICLYGNETALLGQGEGCQYVWMPLSKDSAIRPKKDALRIESPKGSPAVSLPESPPPRRIPPVSETTANTSTKAASNGRAASNGPVATNGQAKPEAANRRTSDRKGAQQDIVDLIAQAEKFRAAAHDLTHQANDLVKALKQHRRQNRVIETTLASIRQITGLGV